MHVENWSIWSTAYHECQLDNTITFHKEHNQIPYLRRYLKPELLGIAYGGEEWNGHVWELFPWGFVVVPTHHLSANPKLIWYTQLQMFKGKIRTVVNANTSKWLAVKTILRQK